MSTLSGALLRAAQLYGKQTAAINAQGSLDWHTMLARVRRAAGGLAALGLKPGERFAVISSNSHDYTEILHAGLWLGAVPVPINPRLAPPEIANILGAADVRLLAGGAALDALRASLPEPFAALPCIALDDAGFGTALLDHAPLARYPAAPDDLAIIYFTSGTQGRPKGVPLRHRHILANAMQVGLAWPRTPGAVCLHVAPMFHSADLLMFSSVIDGSANAYLPAFSPAAFRDAVERYRATDTMLVPAMIGLLLRTNPGEAQKLASLRRLIYGASSMPAPRIEQLMRYLPGVNVNQGYGLSETSPLLCILNHADHLAAVNGGASNLLRACGRPLAGVELRIVNDLGEELPTNSQGEIQARGPNVFDGYLEDPVETAAAFDRGWFRTGDFGYQDEAGYLYILERKSNVIKRGGEKILPAEVENLLNEHPAVVESAVVAVPGRAQEDVIVAVLVTHDNVMLSSGEIRTHCEGRIAAYKIPRRVECVSELPRNAAGKIMKFRLVERYGQAESRAEALD